MSRIIKFRAWDGNRMIFSERGDFYLIPLNKVQVPSSTGHEFYNRDFPVMQFTGLLDKNGKEIYEGDILKSFPYMRLDDTVIISEVKFNDRRGQWVAFSPKYSESEYLFEALKELHETEIIGNIYENPNLLVL